MGVCGFVASGVNFEVDEYLRTTPFEVLCVFHKGGGRGAGDLESGPRPDSGFAAVVSHDDLPHLLDQVSEALEFLEVHEKELERLKGLGVDRMALDFRVPHFDNPQPTHELPAALITAMSRWGMDLIFSVVEIPEAEHHFRRRFNSRRRRSTPGTPRRR
jgi:hypothetical protein